MRRARVAYQGAIHYAIVEEGRLRLPDGRLVGEEEVVWLPPFTPGTAFALGLNYADHAGELAFHPPKEPLVFLKGPNTWVGHRGQTVKPRDVTFMHYECELAVVIGRGGKHISRERAYDHIAGYTVANDYAFRDYLENFYRPNLRVKNRDASTPIGPCLVDKDDIPDAMNLSLRTYVNGELRQEGCTRDMIFDIPFLIAHISQWLTLRPGDVILTGTPRGATPVSVGDEVVTEIDGIGRLVNFVAADG
ncbi:fumarylacetoacetate hydrolase family protein [Alicyclobacillus shizuokensis]|uniref:fumarylacetoacetate hydrolase family protein n=1 Tax=Alicyclobacillus shizuokensis TaxID=392014 RepID=UPI00082F6853|nr:fumarylacetoacetate hydrolase family protein [Alicyclobacillus shizuokensis]MCL6627043.1 fumarylacetoacetate hydrolase family protein [Alicyclobacillus shizuokensis]